MNSLPTKQRYFLLKFSNTINFSSLPLFRGAINHFMKNSHHILFHNHAGDTFRYAYPLIQYKILNKKASIVCVNEGVEAIGLLLNKGTFSCSIGKEETLMEVDKVNAFQFVLQVWDSLFAYKLSNWLPFNQENYTKYIALESIAEKSTFLEKILIGNILSMGKGLGVNFEKEVICKITQIKDNRLLKYKEVKMMAFNVEFKSNVSLPDFIGLGKGASTGFGVVARKKENELKNNLKIK